jgi:polysaccharide chain length determinant protein (PEP-CTERM system associated)
MLGHREFTLDDYLAILRRRLWVILIPAVLVCAGTYLFSRKIPNRYTSQTLVMIEQPKVPENYVRPVVTEQLDQRLGTMREQILSRTRLEPIIQRLGLFKEEVGRAPMEDLVARMRKSIGIKPVRSILESATALPGFRVSFTASDPRLAQQVCAEITSMFMEENLRLREQHAIGTTDFLQNELQEAKRKLDEQDTKLADFKRRYFGQLPGQEQINLNILMGLNTQLEGAMQSLNRIQHEKSYAETLLAQQVREWESSRATYTPQSLEQQLANLKSQLVTLEARYTSNHPDVIKLKHDIAEIEKKVRETAAATEANKNQPEQRVPISEPPHIQQLRHQIQEYEQAIRDKTSQQQKLQEQIAIYRSRVQSSPSVEEQFKILTRDSQTALELYNDLLKKKSQSEMATNLELRQQGEQFRVLDPPDLPQRPSYPNRPLFAAGGFGGGLALGLGIALLLELRDKSLRTERDIEFYLELPALALVPSVGGENGKKKAFWRRAKKPARTGLPGLRLET